MCTHCYKAAAEEQRYSILRILKRGAQNMSTIADQLHVGQPTVTHHLQRLLEVGLLQVKSQGRERIFSLNRKSECFTECGLLKGLTVL